MAWDDTKQALDDFTSSDYNSMVTDQKTRGVPQEETSDGSSLSGSDGSTGRVWTLTNTSTIKTNGILVFRNGGLLDSTEYTVTSTGTSDTVTMDSVPVWNVDKLRIIYFT